MALVLLGLIPGSVVLVMHAFTQRAAGGASRLENRPVAPIRPSAVHDLLRCGLCWWLQPQMVALVVSCGTGRPILISRYLSSTVTVLLKPWCSWGFRREPPFWQFFADFGQNPHFA
jgi:hypothetical protein